MTQDFCNRTARMMGQSVHPRFLAIVTVATLLFAPPSLAPSHGAQRPPPECHEWQECRRLALDARARGEYERFHDLAWRTVQTGPANDPALMYLLARAQSLSGRPRDALLMLRRLADKGVVIAGATSEEDFDRARRLPGWRDLEASMDRIAKADAVPATVPSTPPMPAAAAGTPAAPTALPATARAAAVTAAPSAVATPPVVPNALRFNPRPAEDVARFSAEPFLAVGLAHDAVSGRFLFGDVLGRRVMVLGEGLDTTVDLVRAASAQFHDVTALGIDVKRGDLWVASTARDGAAGAIHRVQLTSGRPIAIIESPPKFQVVRLIDVAIAGNGTILVLDGAAPRVLGLRSGGKTLEVLMPLDVAAPASIAAAGDERTAYVAHRDGIVRLDLRLQRATPVPAPAGIVLGGFEWIRSHRSALVGVQTLPDGSRHIVRLQLNRSGAVTEAMAIEAFLGRDAGPTFATVSGDDLYYLVTQQAESPTTPGARVMHVVVKRIRLP
jgi:hypothetical protein